MKKLDSYKAYGLDGISLYEFLRGCRNPKQAKKII